MNYRRGGTLASNTMDRLKPNDALFADFNPDEAEHTMKTLRESH